MADSPAGKPRAAFDLKSASLPLIAVVLHSDDPAAVQADVEQRLAQAAGYFDQEPVLIDCSQLAADARPDFVALVAALRRLQVMPVAVRGAGPMQLLAARAAGLADAADVSFASPAPTTAPHASAPPAAPAAPPAAPTVIIDRPLRSGQQVYARHADLIVLAAVSNGAEVIADGNVHVYAPLRGKAIAGARGNTEARIFCTNLQAELLSIAGIYRTAEVPLAPEVAGKAAKIHLVGERLVIEPLG